MRPEEILDVALAGNPDAEELKRAMLSPEFVRALKAQIEARPSEQRRRDLVVEYGEKHGGMTLQFLQIFDGAYWGTGLELSLEQCATVLGVSAKELEALYDEMLDEIRPRLLGSQADTPGGDPPKEPSWLRSLLPERRPRPNGAAPKPAGHRAHLQQTNGRTRRKRPA